MIDVVSLDGISVRMLPFTNSFGFVWCFFSFLIQNLLPAPLVLPSIHELDLFR